MEPDKSEVRPRGRPRADKTTRMIRSGFTTSPELYERIKFMARSEKKSASEVIRDALEAYFKIRS